MYDKCYRILDYRKDLIEFWHRSHCLLTGYLIPQLKLHMYTFKMIFSTAARRCIDRRYSVRFLNLVILD